MKLGALLFVLFALHDITPTQGITCYMCKPARNVRNVFEDDEKQHLKDLKNAPTCPNKQEYECPSSYQACACAQGINPNTGVGIARVCYPDKGPVGRCGILDGVKYCYCGTDLCNDDLSSLPIYNLPSDNEQKRKSNNAQSKQWASLYIFLASLIFLILLN